MKTCSLSALQIGWGKAHADLSWQVFAKMDGGWCF